MIRLSAEEIRRPPEQGARLLALRQLDDASAELQRLADPHDLEALHDFRVAVRRLRSALRAYLAFLDEAPARRALSRLGELGSLTNRARDFEVQIAWLEAHRGDLRPSQSRALGRLVRRLEERRRRAYVGANQGIPERFARIRKQLRHSLETYQTRVHVESPAPTTTFAQATARLLLESGAELRRLLGAVTTLADREAAHRARIQAKRLRYLAEPLGTEVEGGKALVKSIKGLQDLLGELNDLHVLERTLASELEGAAVERAQLLLDATLSEDAAALQRARRRDAEAGVLAIAKLASDRSHKLFAALESEWLGDRSARFSARLGDVARALGEEGPSQLEIERKFLLDGLPERVGDESPIHILQGWLPGEEIRERLRRSRGPEGERFYRTIKLGRGIARSEFEQEISATLFEQLWPSTAGSRVEKRRYRIPEGELVWEIDAFADRDLVLAEIELPSPETEVEIPEWLRAHLVREVTDDPEYVNLNLAR